METRHNVEEPVKTLVLSERNRHKRTDPVLLHLYEFTPNRQIHKEEKVVTRAEGWEK